MKDQPLSRKVIIQLILCTIAIIAAGIGSVLTLQYLKPVDSAYIYVLLGIYIGLLIFFLLGEGIVIRLRVQKASKVLTTLLGLGFGILTVLIFVVNLAL